MTFEEKLNKLDQDVFYGRIYMCDKCRRKNMDCTNKQCRAELKRMLEKEEGEKNLQISLF